jgi:ribonuclease HI
MNIQITTKGFVPNGTGLGAWIAEFNSPERQRVINGVAQSNSIRIQLHAIVEAIRVINQNSGSRSHDISIRTNYPLVVQSMPNRVIQWAENNWERDNGQKVQHADLWKELLAAHHQHKIIWEKLSQDDPQMLGFQGEIDKLIAEHLALEQASKTSSSPETGPVRTLIICTPSEKAIQVACQALTQAMNAGETILLYKHKQDNEAKFIQLATKTLYEKFIIAASAENHIPSTWPRLSAIDDKHCLDQAVELADKIILVHDLHDSTIRYVEASAEFQGKSCELHEINI